MSDLSNYTPEQLIRSYDRKLSEHVKAFTDALNDALHAEAVSPEISARVVNRVAAQMIRVQHG